MALQYIAPAVGLGMNIYNAIQANKDRKTAQDRLNELSSQPWERYTVNPAISRYYQTASNMAANPYGFTSAERNNFNQNLNRTLAGQRYLATNMTGGNLSKAINFLDVNSRIGALNDFASRDASLRRSFQNEALGRQFQGASAMQSIDNMNTQTQLARRMQALQAYGAAVQSNKDFVRNTIGGIGRDLISGGIGYFGNNASDGTIPMAGARNYFYNMFNNPESSSYSVQPEAYGYNANSSLANPSFNIPYTRTPVIPRVR